MGKVVVVGLDGATFDVMRPMMEQGRLKNFSALMRSGCSSFLQTVIPANSAVAWNSFATGVNPAKHGVFDFTKRVEGTYSYTPVSSNDRKSRTIWQMASEAGLRCCVVNVPMTYPPEPINGVLISGFPFPESKRDFAFPAGILEEISEKTGVKGFLKPSPHFMNEGEQVGLLDELMNVTRDQGKAVAYLMGKERWDLVVTVFDATDVAGHFFWKYIDKHNPAYNESMNAKYGDLLYWAYDAIDDAFGTIRAQAGPDDTILVVSDHGFGPGYYTVYVNNWLLRSGYLKTKRTAGSRTRRALFEMGFTTGLVFNIAKKTGMVSPRTYGYSKKSARLGVARSLTLSSGDIDWGRTRAYARSTGGGIFVNLVGREPQGTVHPGEEYGELVAELKSRLRELSDERTGELMFDQVMSKDEFYNGPYFGEASDIYIQNSKSRYRPFALFDFGSRRLAVMEQRTSGSHRAQGVLIAGGKEIVSSDSVGNAQLLDMAPTILHLLGLTIPQDADGRVLTEILAPGGEPASRAPKRLTKDDAALLKAAAKRVASRGGL